MTARLLYACVALTIMASLPALIAPAAAQGLPPRPTVPTPTPQPQPTAKPGDKSDTPTAPGRITGTVIDTTTGAPAPGMTVLVGSLTLTTDSNGNYDHSNLPAGTYRVELLVAAGQGTPAQPPLELSLAPGQTLVQHLFFSAPVVPAAPAPLASLPATGGAEAGLSGVVMACLLIAVGAALRRR